MLFESLGIAAIDFRCRAHVEPEGSEEPNPTHTIAFVRRGVFRRSHRHDGLVADPNFVLFFNRGEPYRYAHPFPGGDDCTILTLETPRALELVARHAPEDAERWEAPFRFGHGLCSPRAARLHYELLARVSRGPLLAIEDVLAELTDEAVRAAYRIHEGRATAGPESAGTRRRHRELAEAAKLRLNERLPSPPSLGELARDLECSPFHLSRTFHRIVGLSLRRYTRPAPHRDGRACPGARRAGIDRARSRSRLRRPQPLHQRLPPRMGRSPFQISKAPANRLKRKKLQAGALDSA